MHSINRKILRVCYFSDILFVRTARRILLCTTERLTVRQKTVEPFICGLTLILPTKQTLYRTVYLVCSMDKYGPKGKWDKSE